ncbi:hypothetical protein LJC06_00505 [Bacteroidales bacterium OttesenSCG-928-I14]|nr:hypothetical protein [Bacteroidales bacterium OttesenSCG-928-I14]
MELLIAAPRSSSSTFVCDISFSTYSCRFHKNSGGYVVLEDGNEIEVSPSYKEAFLEAFR